uniref:Uncharacterized protein n=1 Tax=Strigamia maritima TaxID=126957 RepID=T1JIB7_STRMM
MYTPITMCIPKSKLNICMIFTIICLTLVNCHGHGHSHDGNERPPSFKYSREANEDIHSHAHAHDDIHSHSHSHSHAHEHTQHSEKLGWESQEPPAKLPHRSSSSRFSFGLMLQALGATLLVSFVPFLILFVVPVDGTAQHANLLKTLLSFASGGLLGDAFLHLIPHASFAASGANGHSHSHEHGHSHEGGEGHDLSVGLWVLVGIGVFLMVEKCLRIAKVHHSHSHAHSAVAGNKKTDVKSSEPPAKQVSPVGESGDDKPDADGDTLQKEVIAKKIVEKDASSTLVVVVDPHDIKVAGFLNLAADFIHNFTDGMAIGAAFLAGRGIGIITTVTVIFHEIPHEIGDYAILLQSGVGRRTAILLQLVTALGAVAGTLCSLLAEGMGGIESSWTLAFTAGGFIYIATVSVIPELLKDNEVWQSIKEGIALLVGVGMMIIIAKIE